MTKILLTILLLATLIGCVSKEKQLSVSEIFSAIQVENEKFEYSDESQFEIEGVQYSLLQQAVYDANGDLSKFIIYRSEGKIEYQREDIESDRAIIEYLGMPFNQQWVFDKNKIIAEGTSIDVQLVNDSLAKSESGMKITFFRLK